MTPSQPAHAGEVGEVLRAELAATPPTRAARAGGEPLAFSPTAPVTGPPRPSLVQEQAAGQGSTVVPGAWCTSPTSTGSVPSS